MKRLCVAVLLILSLHAQGQDDMSRLLEDQAEQEQESEEDLQAIQRYAGRPLNLNTATSEELSAFPFLHPLQVNQFLSYRKLVGELLSVRELQAVPGWDVATIRKISPFVSATKPESFRDILAEAGRKGVHQLLLRSGLATGSSFLLRYQFRSPRMQFALNTEKDAGEKFWQGDKGISFFSGHVGIQNMGRIRQLILGDYLVNMGQGLVVWQGRAVRKTGMPIHVKRQLPLLQPYRSNDENRFMRGIAMQLAIGRVEAAFFLSRNLLDANTGVDTMLMTRKASSFMYTGYHRTEDELDKKNALGLLSGGSSLSYSIRNFRVAGNVIYHQFSLPVIRASEPYNLYAARGNSMVNYSLHYQQTWRNVHFFGEMALDREKDLALLQGLMVSADPKLDISMVLRKMGKGYRSFQASAFTEATEPANEMGLYMGLSWRPTPVVTVDAYTDHYVTPWMAYRVDAPGRGKDHLVQLTVKPDKQSLLYIRVRAETESAGLVRDGLRVTGEQRKISWRLHLEHRLSREWEWRFRYEANRQETEMEQGWGSLFFADLFWTPDNSELSMNGRFSMYHTTSYDNRIYAFENDVMFYNIVPAFHGSGGRVYLNLRWKRSNSVQFFWKMSKLLGASSGFWNSRFQIVCRL
jgi:hypothetical protein